MRSDAGRTALSEPERMSAGASPTLLPPFETPADAGVEPELVSLRDGSSVRVRPLRVGDEAALRGFLHGLCAEARRRRFFSVVDPDRAAHAAAESTGDRCGLVALDETGKVVGHALFIALDATHAEVAVALADDLHGRGLGTVLIERLAMIAEQRGIRYFLAELLRENRAMLDVFRDGFDARIVRHEGSEERVEFLTSSWRLAHQRFIATGGRAAGA